MEFWTGKER